MKKFLSSGVLVLFLVLIGFAIAFYAAMQASVRKTCWPMANVAQFRYNERLFAVCAESNNTFDVKEVKQP